MNCNNYRGISLLSVSYKMLSNLLLPRMAPYANEIIREYQCRFQRNRLTINHIFSIWQILVKKWEYNKEVYQLFRGFEKTYDSIKRESLYDILIKFGVPKKLGRLIKICLDGTQSKVRIGNYLSSSFPIENRETPYRHYYLILLQNMLLGRCKKLTQDSIWHPSGISVCG